MGIFDALKGLFGGFHNNQPFDSNDHQYGPPPNYFIKPDWANEDEDSDDDLAMRNPPGPQQHFTFSVFTNPLEIHQYFEHQMNEMAKHLHEAFSQQERMFGGNSILDSFFGQLPRGGEQLPAILPSPDEEMGGSLRDKCLKPDARKQFTTQESVDTDLDKEFKNGQISLFKPKDPVQSYSPQPPQVFSSQVFTRIVRRPDGSTEEIRTKQIGDQKYTKIIRTDSAGQTSVHEDIVNIDESKLKDFQSVGEAPLPRIDFQDWFRFRL